MRCAKERNIGRHRVFFSLYTCLYSVMNGLNSIELYQTTLHWNFLPNLQLVQYSLVLLHESHDHCQTNRPFTWYRCRFTSASMRTFLPIGGLHLLNLSSLSPRMENGATRSVRMMMLLTTNRTAGASPTTSAIIVKPSG